MKHCCSAFKKALTKGTDNESYGALIYHYPEEGWTMGSELPRLNYCPWCGKTVTPLLKSECGHKDTIYVGGMPERYEEMCRSCGARRTLDREFKVIPFNGWH